MNLDLPNEKQGGATFHTIVHGTAKPSSVKVEAVNIPQNIEEDLAKISGYMPDISSNIEKILEVFKVELEIHSQGIHEYSENVLASLSRLDKSMSFQAQYITKYFFALFEAQSTKIKKFESLISWILALHCIGLFVLSILAVLYMVRM